MKPATILLVSVVLLLAGATGFWIGRSNLHGTNYAEEIARLQQENQRFKKLTEKADHEGPTSETRSEGKGVLSREPGKRGGQRIPVSLPADAEKIRSLQDNLDAAKEASSAAQARIKELENELHQVREERARLAAAIAEREVQVASAKREAEEKQAELARKTEQIGKLEAANRKVREESSAVGQKAMRQTQLLGELQNLYRRRESYLTTMISRYREITEQYRAFSSVLENRRGPEGTPGTSMSVSGPELGRIQNAIALAEEDLRQLSSLDAQVGRLQKSLSTN